jgi:hypothetical protein
MPFPNEWAVRQNEPGKYDKFRRGQITDGVDAVYGRVKGTAKWEIQTYRFSKTKFKNTGDVQAWMKRNNVSGSIEEKSIMDERVIQLEGNGSGPSIVMQSTDGTAGTCTVTVNGKVIEGAEYVSFEVNPKVNTVRFCLVRTMKDESGLMKRERLEHIYEPKTEAAKQTVSAEFRGANVSVASLEEILRSKDR